MWFRIEKNKDGSIASCVETESSVKDGRYVFYVEASNKAEAIAILASRYDNELLKLRTSRQRRRSARVAVGLCADCKAKQPPERIGKQLCKPCQDRQLKAQNALRARGAAIMPRLDTETKAQRILDLKEYARTRPSRQITTRRRVLQGVLKAFDSMSASSFRKELRAANEREGREISRKASMEQRRASL